MMREAVFTVHYPSADGNSLFIIFPAEQKHSVSTKKLHSRHSRTSCLHAKNLNMSRSTLPSLAFQNCSDNKPSVPTDKQRCDCEKLAQSVQSQLEPSHTPSHSLTLCHLFSVSVITPPAQSLCMGQSSSHTLQMSFHYKITKVTS